MEHPLTGIFVAVGVLQGAGDMLMNLLLSFIWLWVVRIPCAWALAYPAGMGARGIYLGLAIGNVVGGIGMILYFFFGPWHTRQVIGAGSSGTREPG